MSLQAGFSVRGALDQPEPAPRPAPSKQPPTATGSRADLVAWWQWRYASLNAECSRLEALLVQALCESQSYRELGQVGLEQLWNLTQKADQQRRTITRLREELQTAPNSKNGASV